MSIMKAKLLVAKMQANTAVYVGNKMKVTWCIISHDDCFFDPQSPTGVRERPRYNEMNTDRRNLYIFRFLYTKHINVWYRFIKTFTVT